jgi:hypothetical protein
MATRSALAGVVPPADQIDHVLDHRDVGRGEHSVPARLIWADRVRNAASSAAASP